MANYYVIGNSATPPNLTGTPYEGYKIVTENQISSPSSSSPNLMHDGDKVVISGSVNTHVTLQPSSGMANGFKLDVEILDNTNSFNVSAGYRLGGILNYTEPNMTVNVIGSAANVDIGYGNHMETLTVNLADGTSIGNILGSTEADDALIINGGNNVTIGNITSHSGAVNSDSITLGDNATVGNVVLGSGNDTFHTGAGARIGTVDLGAGNDTLSLGPDGVTWGVNTGHGHDVVNIGAGGHAGDITGGDSDPDSMDLTVGDGSTVGNILAGSRSNGNQYGGDDTISLGNNVTAGTITTEAGNDQITIGANSRTGDITAGAGEDTVTTGAGTNTGALNTGSGNDTITIGGQTMDINVGSGATNLTVTATGTTGNLVFGGENDTVVIEGKAGYIQGSGGNDTISVSGTATGIEGNTGDDVITVSGSLVKDDGTAGAIYGGTGSDQINLGDGARVGLIDLGTGGGKGDTLQGGNNVLIDGSLTQDVGDHYSTNTFGDNVTITGHVNLHGGQDTLGFGANASIGGSITMGSDGSADDADVLKIGENSVVEGFINTNRGDDTLYIGDKTTLNGGWNSINTEMGNDIIYLGKDIVSNNSIFTGEGWDTVYAAGGGNYTVDMGRVLPDGDRVSVPYNNKVEKAALEKALADQGWVAGADGIYTHPSSQNATFVWKGVTYTDVWQVNGIPCFVRGTLIRTEHGDVAIENLSVGDMVLTADRGLQPIRWIGQRLLSAQDLARKENLRPIRICAGALGHRSPASDLLVSPQHRILVRSKIAQKMFGTNEVLVAAKQLLQLDGIDIATDMTEVEYFHILFDQHEVVLSNGAETESLYTGPEALKSVGHSAREEIFAIFPELNHDDYQPLSARLLPSGRMSRNLAIRHRQNGKRLVQ